MSRLEWGTTGDRRFETGVDRAVLYPPNLDGVAWNGIVSVSETPTGGDSQSFHYDGVVYYTKIAPEDFSANLQAYSYPDEFELCDGTAEIMSGLYAKYQPRRSFGLSYRTRIGNDVDGVDHGYKIHILYNVMAEPSPVNYQSVSKDPEAQLFSWNLTAVPELVPGFRPTAHYIVDTTKTRESVVIALENLLYGSPANQPFLPSGVELKALFEAAEPTIPFVVTDLGGGLYEISGSDDEVRLLSGGNHFELSSEYVIDNADGSFTATTGDEFDPDGPVTIFTVTDLGGGLFRISGPDSMVFKPDENHYTLDAPFVTDNGDGSFTAVSAS